MNTRIAVRASSRFRNCAPCSTCSFRVYQSARQCHWSPIRHIGETWRDAEIFFPLIMLGSILRAVVHTQGQAARNLLADRAELFYQSLSDGVQARRNGHHFYRVPTQALAVEVVDAEKCPVFSLRLRIEHDAVRTPLFVRPGRGDAPRVCRHFLLPHPARHQIVVPSCQAQHPLLRHHAAFSSQPPPDRPMPFTGEERTFRFLLTQRPQLIVAQPRLRSSRQRFPELVCRLRVSVLAARIERRPRPVPCPTTPA